MLLLAEAACFDHALDALEHHVRGDTQAQWFIVFSNAPCSSCTLYIAHRRTMVITPFAIIRDEYSTGHISAFQECSNASDDAVDSAHHTSCLQRPQFVIDVASNARGIALIVLLQAIHVLA